MEAACIGVNEKNGTTKDILPSADKNEANKYIDHPIVTDLGMLKNSLVVLNGDFGWRSMEFMEQHYLKYVLHINTESQY